MAFAHERFVGSNELLQWPGRVMRVKDRPKRSEAEKLGKLVGVDAITLVLLGSGLARVTHEELRAVRQEQIVEPLRLRSFLEGHMKIRPESMKQRYEVMRIRRHDSAFEDAPLRAPD